MYKIGSTIRNGTKLYDVLSIMWNVIKKNVYDIMSKIHDIVSTTWNVKKKK